MRLSVRVLRLPALRIPSPSGEDQEEGKQKPPKLSTKDLETLQKHTFFAKEKNIAASIEDLYREKERLEAIGQNKVIALSELKQSLLQKSFSGELTATSFEDVVFPHPRKIPGISETDLHAGILAMSFELHEQHGKGNEFGRVKAEKTAHMVEAWVGIELGRQPIKDAAGPNDFHRLHIVQSRAKKAGYFEFLPSDRSRYRFSKLNRFGNIIEKSKKALGEKDEEVYKLLNIMVQLTPRQAEIMATTFSAWNNLLLEGQPPNDDEIAYEARENWHPNKLNIERERFLRAIEWLRQKDIVPRGRGKRVLEKEG